MAQCAMIHQGITIAQAEAIEKDIRAILVDTLSKAGREASTNLDKHTQGLVALQNEMGQYLVKMGVEKDQMKLIMEKFNSDAEQLKSEMVDKNESVKSMQAAILEMSGSKDKVLEEVQGKSAALEGLISRLQEATSSAMDSIRASYGGVAASTTAAIDAVQADGRRPPLAGDGHPGAGHPARDDDAQRRRNGIRQGQRQRWHRQGWLRPRRVQQPHRLQGREAPGAHRRQSLGPGL